jgi:hypothetical protein
MCVHRSWRYHLYTGFDTSTFEQINVTVELDSRFGPDFLSSSLWFRSVDPADCSSALRLEVSTAYPPDSFSQRVPALVRCALEN